MDINSCVAIFHSGQCFFKQDVDCDGDTRNLHLEVLDLLGVFRG